MDFTLLYFLKHVDSILDFPDLGTLVLSILGFWFIMGYIPSYLVHVNTGRPHRKVERDHYTWLYEGVLVIHTQYSPEESTRGNSWKSGS